MKILLVEDDEDIRMALKELLTLEGHDCTEAADGLAAKLLLEKDPAFDLMMTDFRMPNMDGVELLAWCRENAIHTPVIFLSADARLFDREKMALAESGAELLKKPVEIQVLLDAIESSRAHSKKS